MDKVIKKKILVLGASGMLGSMVFKYFLQKDNFELRGTVRDINDFVGYSDLLYNLDVSKDYSRQLSEITNKFIPDYIINCIGIINKYCRDDDLTGIRNAIRINSLFPYDLSDFYKKISSSTR